MKTIRSIIPNSKNRPTFGLQRASKLNLQDFEGSWFTIWTLSLHPLQRTRGHMRRFTFLLDSPSPLLGWGGWGLVPRAVRPWIHILSCKLRQRTLGFIKPMRFPILLLQLPSSKWRRTKKLLITHFKSLQTSTLPQTENLKPQWCFWSRQFRVWGLGLRV